MLFGSRVKTSVVMSFSFSTRRLMFSEGIDLYRVSSKEAT